MIAARALRFVSAFQRLARTHDGRWGLGIVGGMLLASTVGAAALSDPNESLFALSPAADGGPPRPSWAHPLGTDALYRDALSRLLHGGRVSLAVALLASTLGVVAGAAVGLTAAVTARGSARIVDELLMRMVDVLLAFPFLLFVTLIGVLLGRTDEGTLILVLGLSSAPAFARVIRARALSVLEQEFVAAARALGSSRARIAFHHLLPNVLGTVLALGASLVGSMILAEAVLGYLAVGLPPPTASWGRMLHEAEPMIVLRPALVAAPAVAILLLCLGFHRLAEGLTLVGLGAQKRAPPRARFPLDLALVTVTVALLVALPRAELAAPPLGPDSPPPPQRGGVLRLATMYPVHTLDPALAADEGATAVSRWLFGRLVEIDEQGRFIPGLTQAIEWRDGGRSLHLTLRAGLRFSDGSVLDATSVKRSIERALGPNVPSPGAHHYADLVGFADFRSGKAPALSGVEVASEREVILRLSEPNATLPSLLSLPFVVPLCASAPVDPRVNEPASLCGAGPFRVRAFDAEHGLSLERNARYFEPDLPYLEGIDLAFNVRPQAQRFRFERGELDLVRELSSSDAALFRADARYRPHMRLVENLRSGAVFLNTERPPFDNVALRRAVSLALDPAVLARLRPDVVELDRVVPAGVPGRPASARSRRHDLAAALVEMERAGYAFDPKSGRGGYPHEVEYVTIPDTFEQAAAEIYQQQLAKVGIRIHLKLLPAASYFAETQRRGRTLMGWAGWQADYPDPITFFDPNLVSSAIGEVSQNYSCFRSAELDEQIERARRETDPGRRALAFARAEEIVIDEAPWIPTTSPRTVELSQPWLFGYEPNPVVALDFTRTFLARGPSQHASGLLDLRPFPSSLPRFARSRP